MIVILLCLLALFLLLIDIRLDDSHAMKHQR